MSDGIKEGSIFWNLQVKTDNAKKNVDKLSSSLNNLNKAFGLFKMTAFIKGLQQIGKTIANNLQKQAKYIQTQNTFTKSLGESANEAKKFRDALQEKLGIDAQESMTAMSTFQRLAENMGLANEEAYLMSKNLTSLASDFTAYGYSFSEATTKLRAGLTGQIKGMKTLGVSLDEATLQQTLYSLGIDRTVSSLTKAQKTELLYYQIMTQTSKMQNTLAETMNSPANMLRILQQEFTQLGRAIGAVFIPIAMKIIPVVRAIVQELKKLAEWLGTKAKYDESDYTGYYDSLLEISDGFDDIEESATGAGKAINKMLMPFDELNNINFSKAAGSGAGAGAGGSIFDSLEELPNYDVFKGLDENIGKKVDEYKEKIEKLIPVFKTLGTVAAAAFGIGKLTEFLLWTDKVHTALSNLGALGGLIEIGFGMLLAIGGIWAQWKGTKKLLNGDYSIWAILETIGGTAIGTFGIATALRGLATITGYELPLHKALGIGLSIMTIIKGFEVIDDAVKNQDIGKFILGTFENILGFGTLANQLLPKGQHSSNFSDLKWAINIGIAITFAEITYEYSKKAYEDMKKINTEEFDRQGVFKDIGTATATGAIAGSRFGLIGAGIGATAGLLISSFSAIKAGVTELKNLTNDTTEVNRLFVSVLENESEEYLAQKANIDELIKAYNARIDSINKTKEADLLSIKVSENYIEDLDKLVDSNGKVIKGNEKRVDFILGELNSALGTEYSLNDGLITSNGKVIDSYDSMKQNLQELMEKKREEAEQTANIELYKEAYTQRQRMLENFNTKYAEVQRLRAELQEKEKNGLQKGSDEWRAYQKKINEALLLSNEAYENWVEANELTTQRGAAAFGEYEQTIEQTMDNTVSEVDKSSKGIIDALYNRFVSSETQQKISNAMKNLTNLIPEKFRKYLLIGSPSKVMYEAAQWIPAGVAEGINSKASLVEDSMENLTDKMRIDQQDFDFYSSADLASSINGKIQTQTSAALNENTLQNMANATYEAMSRALIDNNDDYNPQFNVYVGNDKVYSGYANYQNNESNKYGVKV